MLFGDEGGTFAVFDYVEGWERMSDFCEKTRKVRDGCFGFVVDIYIFSNGGRETAAYILLFAVVVAVVAVSEIQLT